MPKVPFEFFYLKNDRDPLILNITFIFFHFWPKVVISLQKNADRPQIITE